MTDPRHTQPPGWAQRACLLDDTAPHQIRIGVHGPRLFWSCTCQRNRTGHRPLGSADGLTVPEINAAHAEHVARASAA